MKQINQSIFEERYYVGKMPIQAFKNLINDSDDAIIHISSIRIVKIEKTGEHIYLRIKTKEKESLANSYFQSVYNATSFYYVHLYHKLLLMGFKLK